jgi:phospholipid-translocating ATPase
VSYIFYSCRKARLTLVSKDLSFVVTLGFAWKLAIIVAIGALPLWIIKLVHHRLSPAVSSKIV